MAEEKKEVKEQEGIVWHENTEAPEFYPEKLIPAEIEDVKGVLLDQCHSKHYHAPDYPLPVLPRQARNAGQGRGGCRTGL